MTCLFVVDSPPVKPPTGAPAPSFLAKLFGNRETQQRRRSSLWDEDPEENVETRIRRLSQELSESRCVCILLPIFPHSPHLITGLCSMLTNNRSSITSTGSQPGPAPGVRRASLASRLRQESLSKSGEAPPCRASGDAGPTRSGDVSAILGCNLLMCSSVCVMPSGSHSRANSLDLDNLDSFDFELEELR